MIGRVVRNSLPYPAISFCQEGIPDHSLYMSLWFLISFFQSFMRDIIYVIMHSFFIYVITLSNPICLGYQLVCMNPADVLPLGGSHDRGRGGEHLKQWEGRDEPQNTSDSLRKHLICTTPATCNSFQNQPTSLHTLPLPDWIEGSGSAQTYSLGAGESASRDQ